jgi:RelE-like toxin of type II toxin-antitoxin system HigB
MKLQQLNVAGDLKDLSIPSRNQLEALKGDRRGEYSIRINKQWRICCRWREVFRKAVGSAPGAYRKRFGRNGILPADFAAKDGSRQKKHILEAGLHTG